MKISSFIGRVILVTAIVTTAIACGDGNGTASGENTGDSATALQPDTARALTPADTVSAAAFPITGDMARDAATFVKVLYDKDIPFNTKDSVAASFTAYYQRNGHFEQWEKAVDVESRKLTGEEQL